MNRLLAFAGLLGIAVGVACKTTTSGGNGCESTLPDVVIAAQDNRNYDKPDVTISRQQRVCWENNGSLAHSVTALVTRVNADNTVDTLWNIDGQLNPNLVVLSTFNTVGDFPYHCRYHQSEGMTGTIHVR
jgi:plastocyanin